MSQETNIIVKAVAEQITRMQESTGSTTSRLFYDLDKKVAVGFQKLSDQGEEMIKHQKHTNGDVQKNKKDIAAIKDCKTTEHAEMIRAFEEANRKMIEKFEKKLSKQFKTLAGSGIGIAVFLASLHIPGIETFANRVVSIFI